MIPIEIDILQKALYNNAHMFFVCDDKLNFTWQNIASGGLWDIKINKSLKDVITDIDYANLLSELFDGKSVKASSNSYIVQLSPIIIQSKLSAILTEVEPKKQEALMADSSYKNDSIALMTSQYRNHLSNIFNHIPLLAHTLQQYELYSEVNRLNNIAKNCYIILRHTINYSFYQRICYNCVQHQPKPIFVNSYILDLCKSIELMLRSTDQTFLFDVTNENIVANIDTENLTLALLNIISNTCKYTNTDNEIKFTLQKQNNHIILTISDTGVGIRSEDLPHIFEPYFTKDATDSMLGGIGLGLTIAQQVINMHKGSILVNSAFNKGTTVSIKIPIDENIDLATVKSPDMGTITNKFSNFYIFLAEFANFAVF